MVEPARAGGVVVIRRRALHRASFTLAGIYNLAWGAYSVLDPEWFFRFAGLEPLNHPAIFACLGMVIGLYGCSISKLRAFPSEEGCSQRSV